MTPERLEKIREAIASARGSEVLEMPLWWYESCRDLLVAHDEVRAEVEAAYWLGMDVGYEAGAFDSLLSEDKRLLAPLTWTREPPTKPGWYWRRHPMGATWAVFCDEVYQHRGQLCRMGDIDVTASPDCEWAGPIPEPRDPASSGGS